MTVLKDDRDGQSKNAKSPRRLQAIVDYITPILLQCLINNLHWPKHNGFSFIHLSKILHIIHVLSSRPCPVVPTADLEPAFVSNSHVNQAHWEFTERTSWRATARIQVGACSECSSAPICK